MSDPYPVRFDVKLLLRVPVDNGVRLDEVRSISADSPLWGWVFRSLNEIPETDAEWIMERLRETEPHLGPLDPEPFEATPNGS
jgi:hypothetical protein